MGDFVQSILVDLDRFGRFGISLILRRPSIDFVRDLVVTEVEDSYIEVLNLSCSLIGYVSAFSPRRPGFEPRWGFLFLFSVYGASASDKSPTASPIATLVSFGYVLYNNFLVIIIQFHHKLIVIHSDSCVRVIVHWFAEFMLFVVILVGLSLVQWCHCMFCFSTMY